MTLPKKEIRRRQREICWGVGLANGEAAGMTSQMFNSFLDGTKPALEMAAIANATGLTPPRLGGLPIGLAHGVTFKTGIAADAPLRWQDVEIDETLGAVRLRREMEAMFAPARAAE